MEETNRRFVFLIIRKKQKYASNNFYRLINQNILGQLKRSFCQFHYLSRQRTQREKIYLESNFDFFASKIVEDKILDVLVQSSLNEFVIFESNCNFYRIFSSYWSESTIISFRYCLCSLNEPLILKTISTLK